MTRSKLDFIERPERSTRFSRATAGTTLIEFALIAPVLMLLMVGILEISLIMFAGHVLESAVFSASRSGKTGYAATGKTREETIIDALKDRASGLLDVTRISVTTRAYDEFSSIGDHEPFVDVNGNGVRDQGENYTDQNGNGQYDGGSGSEGLGNAGDVIVYTVTYPWPLFTPMIAELIGNGGIFTLSARAVVKNEPY